MGIVKTDLFQFSTKSLYLKPGYVETIIKQTKMCENVTTEPKKHPSNSPGLLSHTEKAATMNIIEFIFLPVEINVR